MTKNKTDELDSTNVQESADLARQQANKLLAAIAIEATKEAAEEAAESENLKDKLIGVWVSAPEGTDSTELRAEIDAACDAGESAMEELLIKLTERAQIDGSAEQSIMNKPQNQTIAKKEKLKLEAGIREDKLYDLLIDVSQAMPDGLPDMFPEVLDATEVGVSAMEDLLIKMLDIQQTAGSGEESINDGHAKSVLPTPSAYPKRNQ